MKQSHPSSIKGYLIPLMARLKAVACADYQLSDFHPSKIRSWLQSSRSRRQLKSSGRMNGSSWRTHLLQSIVQHQGKWIYYGLLIVALILSLSIYSPFVTKAQDHLLLRPTQWAYLQNLARDSQLDTRPVEVIARFDEVELQRLRALLLSRGIKPTVLSISAGNPPNIELHADGVMFSTVLELLDEVRSIWHLYPSEVSVRRTDSAGVVDVKSHLVQYSTSDIDSLNGPMIR